MRIAFTDLVVLLFASIAIATQKMTEFRLYNTMSRAIEPFAPADGETVRLYTCGPTVYNPAHLGNFRTFLFEDLLRRALRLRGWKVRQVMNLTDVDDKIIKRAREQGKTIREVTEPVIEIFHEDRQYLRIQRAEHYPRATEYIPQMIELVERLVERRVAYQAEEVGVFRDRPVSGLREAVAARHARGQDGCAGRAGRLLEGERAGFRALEGGEAGGRGGGRGVGFAVGPGRAGLASRVLGDGDRAVGRDARPALRRRGPDIPAPRGRDRAVGGGDRETFSRCWCHGEFLLTDGAKMAKRVGNVITVADLREAQISAAAVRHFVFTTHYRKELNLSEEALEASTTRCGGWGISLTGWDGDRRHAGAGRSGRRGGGGGRGGAVRRLQRAAGAGGAVQVHHAANAELDRRGRRMRRRWLRRSAAFAQINGGAGYCPRPRRRRIPSSQRGSRSTCGAAGGAERRDFARGGPIRASWRSGASRLRTRRRDEVEEVLR